MIGMVGRGIVGFGGGGWVIGLIGDEGVVKYEWVNDEEFGERLAIGNELAGMIATKMSAYMGY
ncbi:chromate transporter, partial [Bacillus pumilus]|uniref:chromate transporter n=1 Tax=Bacillus pumilus TaxID=1408 RepID=UPI0021B26028